MKVYLNDPIDPASRERLARQVEQFRSVFRLPVPKRLRASVRRAARAERQRRRLHRFRADRAL